MTNLLKSILQMVLGALAVLAVSAAMVRADCGPVKIDAGLYWKFDVKLGCGSYCPKAPWYAYFPYDPNMQRPGPVNPYPVWPQPFPPAVQPMPPATPQLSTSSYSSGIQPASYYPGGVPSYWYGH